MRRVFLKGAHPGEATVSGPAFHHLVRVQRLVAGDEVEVFDGEGQLFPARLTRVGEAEATLALGPARAAAPLNPITVVQALAKADKLEWVLQKGTELGATAFAPFAAARSVVKLTDKAPARVQRWQKVAEEAARQCGRADVPPVLPVRALVEALDALAPGTQVLLLDEEERALRLSQALGPVPAPLALVVGPEGGLTRDEVDAAKARGAVAVSLGRRILRTETAALAALAVLRHLEGELG